MSYQVFARKYRPQTFDDVIGQEHITRTLKNAIEGNRLAHAYIFVGPRGTGKTSTARILAKALNCTGGPRVDFDPEEDICKEIAEGRSMDVLEFDAASNTQVDKIREIIIDNVKYAPTRGRHKVYIVDEVHMLSASSFNALLKTLEEPPDHVKFVFATTDVQKVPSTILSRCQRFDLKRIPAAKIRDHLLYIARMEGVALSAAAADAVARGADGGMRDAESMLDQLVAFCDGAIDEEHVQNVFGFTTQQTVSALCDHLLAGDNAAALGVVHQQAEAGRDLTRLLADLISHLRNLLIAKADASSFADEFSDEAVRACVAQAERLPLDRLLDLIDQFAAAEGRMKWAPNKKMHLEVAVIRAIQTLGQATLDEVLDTLTALRNGETALPAATPAPRSPRSSAAVPKKAAPAPPVEVKSEQFLEKIPASAPPTAEHASGAAAEPAADPGPLAPTGPSIPVAERDTASLWAAAIEEVRASRSPLRLWIEAGTLEEISGDTAVIAFPSDQALAVDHFQKTANRQALEEVLSRLLGRPLRLRCQVREGLAVPESRPESKRAPVASDPVEEFKNDPLIRRALEIFKAEIQLT